MNDDAYMRVVDLCINEISYEIHATHSVCTISKNFLSMKGLMSKSSLSRIGSVLKTCIALILTGIASCTYWKNLRRDLKNKYVIFSFFMFYDILTMKNKYINVKAFLQFITYFILN